MATVGAIHIHAINEEVTPDLLVHALMSAIKAVQSGAADTAKEMGEYVRVLGEGVEFIVHGGYLDPDSETGFENVTLY